MAAALELVDFSDLENTREISDEDTKVARALAASLPSCQTRAAEPSPASWLRESMGRTTPFLPSADILAALQDDGLPETIRAPYVSELVLNPDRAVPVSPSVFSAPSTPREASRFLVEIAADDLRLASALSALEEYARVAHVEARDSSSSYTAKMLRGYAEDIAELRAAACLIAASCGDARVAALIGSSTNIGVYLKGAYLFGTHLAFALSTFAASSTSDLPLLGARIEAAAQMHFQCLAEQIRADVRVIADVPLFAEQLEELLFVGFRLAETVKRDVVAIAVR